MLLGVLFQRVDFKFRVKFDNIASCSVGFNMKIINNVGPRNKPIRVENWNPILHPC